MVVVGLLVHLASFMILSYYVSLAVDNAGDPYHPQPAVGRLLDASLICYGSGTSVTVLPLITIFFPRLSPFVAGVELVMFLMRLVKEVTDPLALVTTWTSDAFCCVRVVSDDFFEQLTNANVIIESATIDLCFCIVSNQTPCSR